MSNSFNLQPEDQCLNFLREDSYQQQFELFQNIQYGARANQDANHVNQSIQNIEKSVKRNRNENQKKNSSKKKVFYRQKMAHLISEQAMKKCEAYNYGELQKGKNGINRDQQLKRNRESAKISRQRRKQYVQVLELKNQQNQMKIQELTIRLRQAQLQRDRLKEDNRSYIKSFLAAKNEAYEHLSQILKKSGYKATDQLSQQMRILIARYGAAGSQRIAATDYYMKQIIQILIGDIHKYIIDSAVNDSGLLGVGEWTKLDEQVCQILKTTKENRYKLSKGYKAQMVQQFDTFKAVTQKFYDAYRVVQNQGRIIQKMFEKITLQFNDAQIASLLLWIQQNKFSKQLKKIRAEWVQSVQKSPQLTGKARKLNNFQMISQA